MDTTDKEKQFILPDSVRRGILEYFGKQPYDEVANGVLSLQTLVELPQE